MVDVGSKDVTHRTAVATGEIRMSEHQLALVRDQTGPKGNVLTTAELAGTMGAKRTADLIPLCHQLPLSHVEVTAEPVEALPGVRVSATARAVARTGVEMEALTAVSVALMTIYDMVKAAGHGMQIENIRLVRKTGGTGGDWESTTDTPAEG